MVIEIAIGRSPDTSLSYGLSCKNLCPLIRGCTPRQLLDSALTKMLETVYKHLETLQEQARELPLPQQAIFTKILENLSNSLQEMAGGTVFNSSTNKAAKLVEIEKINRLLERTVAQQASQIRQLQEQLEKEISQHRRDNQALTKVKPNCKLCCAILRI